MATPTLALRFTTELRETGYITEGNLRAKLVELFGPSDYRISVGLQMRPLPEITDSISKTKQERWIYFAPRKLTSVSSSITQTLDALTRFAGRNEVGSPKARSLTRNCEVCRPILTPKQINHEARRRGQLNMDTTHPSLKLVVAASWGAILLEMLE
jgi:hypothetical protein